MGIGNYSILPSVETSGALPDWPKYCSNWVTSETNTRCEGPGWTLPFQLCVCVWVTINSRPPVHKCPGALSPLS